MTLRSINFVHEDNVSSLKNDSERELMEVVTFVKQKLRKSKFQGEELHALILNICSNLIINCYEQQLFDHLKNTKERCDFLTFIGLEIKNMLIESWHGVEAAYADKSNAH